MRIVAHEIVAIGGALASPLAGRWARRDGLLLRLTDERGEVGIGEASPLPDYSPDDLDGARAALAALDWSRPLSTVRAAVAAIDARQPAARFAVETALLDLVARRRPAKRAREVAACALVGDLDGARGAWARGVRCFKVKVGLAFDRAFAEMQKIRCVLPDATLRADANRAFSTGEAAERVRALGSLGVEYVEEPAADWAALDGIGVPLAADESLRDRDFSTVIARARVLVLKPMVLGGALRCLDLARVAAARGVDAVASHAFDGPVALRATVALARALPTARAHGIDRHAALDVLGA